jgi:hypothetical protein
MCFLQYVRINVRREEFLPSPMNLACQNTCKSLLQVKQRFVIHFEFQLAMRLPLERQRSCVEITSSVLRTPSPQYGEGLARRQSRPTEHGQYREVIYFSIVVWDR